MGKKNLSAGFEPLQVPAVSADEKSQGPRVAVATLGCKVNQCESAGLIEILTARGMTPVPFDSPAECYIVNTCTVTARTDGQSRQLIRRAVRQNPSATVIVTGCYAQRAPEELARIPGVSLVAGNTEKERIPDFLEHPGAGGTIRAGAMDRQRACSRLGAVRFPGHTRAFLKIQEGCDASCSYCIVPSVRGGSRSLPPAEVCDRLDRIAAAGHREVVLTGIHLGAYGRDLTPASALADLLDRIAAETPLRRLRLSSIEPREITEGLIERMAAGGLLCRHLHIPLQSGDDAVLKAMNRNYDAAFFGDLVHRLARAVPDIAVGIDVMAGFPGETEAAFARTVRLIEAIPVAYLHVFPFSPRPGTVAAGLAGQIPEAVKKERTALLRTLGEHKRRRFAEGVVGTAMEVLLDTRRDRLTGFPLGLSDHYLTLAVRNGGTANRFVRVRPESYTDGRLLAEVIDE